MKNLLSLVQAESSLSSLSRISFGVDIRVDIEGFKFSQGINTGKCKSKSE